MNTFTAKRVYKINNIAFTSGKNKQLYKASIATREFEQIHGSDFEETFPFVISFPSLKIVSFFGC